MGQLVCRYRGTRASLLKEIAAVASSAASADEIGRGIKCRMGVALLGRIQQSFLVLSSGATDPAVGYAWKPLKPETIARRRTTPGEKRQLGIGGRRERGLLTPEQNKKWKQIFGSRLAKLLLQGVAEGAAKALAAKIAWSVLKQEGAQTKIGTLGRRTVPILRDTGILFRSLTPGVEDKPSGAPGQIFEVTPDAVIVGTNVPYASRVHAMRPLWPSEIPPSWWDAINGAAATGLAEAVIKQLGRGS